MYRPWGSCRREAKEIINRYKGDDGRLNITKGDRETKMHYFLDYNMRKLSELTGIKNLIYYSARKSFSQHAFDLGISTSIIDFILGHRVDKGGTSLYSYISVTPSMATKSVRQVLDEAHLSCGGCNGKVFPTGNEE